MRFFLLALGLWAAAPLTVHAEFSGRIRGEEQYFIEKQYGSASQAESSVQVELEEKQALGETWKFRLEPRVRFSTLTHPVDVPTDGDFRDTFAEKNFGFMRVQAGSFIKAWEGTDGLNPMDIASVHSLRDPLNAESIGSVGLAAIANVSESVSVDALYVPWQTPVRLPGNNSPWWPQRTSLPLESGKMKLLVPDAPEYDVPHHDSLNNALKDNYGARVQVHYSSWDFSVGAFEGAAQIPIFQPIISGNAIQTSPKLIVQMNNPIVVQPIEYRRRTISTSVVKTEQSWIFRLAARYDKPMGDDSRLPGHSEQAVAGVEKTFSVSNQTMIALVQFAYERKADVAQSVLNTPDPFERAILLGLRLPYSDDLLFFVSGLMDVKKSSSLARFNVQKKLGGHFSVDGTVEWIRGSEETLLGQWKTQSRAFLMGTYQF
ncbi:MAG: hypothetical protein ACXVA9_12640 [Bdellovibrionales bacterium]